MRSRTSFFHQRNKTNQPIPAVYPGERGNDEKHNLEEQKILMSDFKWVVEIRLKKLKKKIFISEPKDSFAEAEKLGKEYVGTQKDKYCYVLVRYASGKVES